MTFRVNGAQAAGRGLWAGTKGTEQVQNVIDVDIAIII